MNSQDKNRAGQQVTLKAQDFKTIVKNQGRTKIGSSEFYLNSQDRNNPHLKTIVDDASFTVRAISDSSNQKARIYELKGAGKTLSVTVNVNCVDKR